MNKSERPTSQYERSPMTEISSQAAPAPEPTEEMIDAALPWLRSFQHMRATDKRGAVEQALRAAFALATPPISEQPAPDGAASLTERIRQFLYSKGWVVAANRDFLCRDDGSEQSIRLDLIDALAAALAAKPEPVSAPAPHEPECPMARPGHSERTWNCICGRIRERRGVPPMVDGIKLPAPTRRPEHWEFAYPPEDVRAIVTAALGAEPVSEQPAPAEAPEPWTDAKLRGIASDYFREAKDWPAAMLCMRHLLMEQRAAAPAEAGSAPLAYRQPQEHVTDAPGWLARRLAEGVAGSAPMVLPEPQIRWPKSDHVERQGDMGPQKLRITLDGDNDVIVSTMLGESVEFCNGGSGGGKSPATRAALINLMSAIEQDATPLSQESR